MGRPVGLRWDGEVFSELSLAQVNRALCAALLDHGGVALTIDAPPDGPILASGDPRARRLAAHVGAPVTPIDVTVRHRWPPRFDRPPSGRYVHVQPWEFGELPRPWADAATTVVDEVWCYTSYVREMYVRAGVAPERAVVVPCGIDATRFRIDGPRATLPTKKSFVVLFVGGTIYRKGIDVAVNAFVKAFRPDDDVALVVKDVGRDSAYRGQTVHEQILGLTGRADLPEIRYVHQVLPDDAMPALYRSADVLLHPYRGEGFGLPVLEAMACGAVPIVTRGGSTDDFVDDACGVRIPSRRAPVALGDFELVAPGWLLEPDVEATATALRALYERRDATRELGRRAAAAAAPHTWSAAAAIAAGRLEAISPRSPSPA